MTTTGPDTMKTPPPSYRIGVIGCGRMGRLHTSLLNSDQRSTVTALFDTDSAAAERLRDELVPHAEVYESVDALLGEGAIDAAIICTPTTAHFDQIQACRRAGCAVLCEKPLADTAERIRQLIDASSCGPPLVVAYQRRSWSTYRTLRREVQSGRWGEIQAVTSHNTEYWQQRIAGTWRDDPAINPGGFLGDAGSHKLDALFYVTRLRPAAVTARSDNCGSSVPVVTLASVTAENGVPIALDFIGNAHHQAEDLQIHCVEADLMIRDWRVWIARGNVVEPLSPLEPDSQPAITFLDLLDGSIGNPAPPSCAWPVFALTEAILTASRTGTSVDIADC
jgi:predicted dehydrogenase